MLKYISFSFGLICALSVHSALAAIEVAKINTKSISLEDFNKQYQDQMKYFRLKIPTKEGFLNEMVNREVAILEAKKLGLEKDPEVIDRINGVLYQSLIEKKLGPKFNAINVSDGEASEFYSKNPEIRSSHIFVQLRYDATKAQEKAALEKIKRLQKTLNDALASKKQTFADIARQFSDGVAAAAGGDIDYQTKDKLDPAYYQAAIKLDVGEVSDIVRSQFGYHIIKLTGKHKFSEVDKGHIKRLLIEDTRGKIFDEYITGIKKNYQVSARYDLLNQ